MYTMYVYVYFVRLAAASPTNYDDYKARASRILGGILIAVGVVVTVFVSASASTDIEEVNRDFSPIFTSVFVRF